MVVDIDCDALCHREQVEVWNCELNYLFQQYECLDKTSEDDDSELCGDWG